MSRGKSVSKVCKICGIITGQLQSHLKSTHGIDVSSEELVFFNKSVDRFPGVKLSYGIISGLPKKFELVQLNDESYCLIIKYSDKSTRRPSDLLRKDQALNDFYLKFKSLRLMVILSGDEVRDIDYTSAYVKYNELEYLAPESKSIRLFGSDRSLMSSQSFKYASELDKDDDVEWYMYLTEHSSDVDFMIKYKSELKFVTLSDADRSSFA